MAGSGTCCGICGRAICQSGTARVWVHENQYYRVFNHRAVPHSGGLCEPPVAAHHEFSSGSVWP